VNKFSIEYPEYHIAGLIQDDFPKANNFSVSIPLSRQQKYYDLLLHNANNKKCLAIQVKSSRTYVNTDTTDDLNDYNYYAWLNNFQVNTYSDYYFIFISFPLFDTTTFRPKTALGTKILVFDTNEMTNLLANIRNTKSGNPDKFFGFGFNMNEDKIFGTRGFNINPRQEFTNNLYENKIDQIRQGLN
jgi:hypothetical protein